MLGHQELGPAVLCTECSQLGDLIQSSLVEAPLKHYLFVQLSFMHDRQTRLLTKQKTDTFFEEYKVLHDFVPHLPYIIHLKIYIDYYRYNWLIWEDRMV